ncbi:transcriptional regulator [Staphylococcus simiae]|uniref:helix-turn-helix transcriptional regulator n=1 Tax=Staphylococcus simiae TaxID=308354 RepID=UPI001A982E53|nr:transcriptional regulator [Staphylococcus simiae]MBO1198286.1 transcriptional regulator [Staphylococcus simiae]MBO1201979.1 transcriptional regulator [Staphylococcus simiae]MBO1204189.1 transcriptional regulator [Staphylococcus simiae]MBO1210278.1 transcriptional regulator [Staphylococcus simiae]MBO1230423.1 transcriptional regulator [Staphylococcus simiae]
MDRAYRILTIYNRLLQHKEVNKKSLVLELETSARTIQRDIDDIRHFLYETKLLGNVENEIIYDYKSETYRLEQHKNENINFMYDILTSLYFTTPTISSAFQQYLKLLIAKHHTNTQNKLSKFLNYFDIDENKSNYTPISVVTQALNENKFLQYNKTLLLPLSMFYQFSRVYLVYLRDNDIYMNDINNMKLLLSNKSFSEQDKGKAQQYVTFELTKEVWLEIHKSYDVHLIESYDDYLLIVTFKMTQIEAIQLCFMYRSNIRIISPHDLKTSVIEELLLLQATYLNQSITNTLKE